jgi:hypothetical protein
MKDKHALTIAAAILMQPILQRAAEGDETCRYDIVTGVAENNCIKIACDIMHEIINHCGETD